MSFIIKSIPQGDEEAEYPENSFTSLFDAIFGGNGVTKKQSDDDWIDDYINKRPSEGTNVPCNLQDGYATFSVTSGASEGEAYVEDDDDDDDDEVDEVEYLDNETNVALAIYDVLSSPASVTAEQDATDAILHLQKVCEADFISKCGDEYLEDVEPFFFQA